MNSRNFLKYLLDLAYDRLIDLYLTPLSTLLCYFMIVIGEVCIVSSDQSSVKLIYKLVLLEYSYMFSSYTSVFLKPFIVSYIYHISMLIIKLLKNPWLQDTSFVSTFKLGPFQVLQPIFSKFYIYIYEVLSKKFRFLLPPIKLQVMKILVSSELYLYSQYHIE